MEAISWLVELVGELHISFLTCNIILKSLEFNVSRVLYLRTSNTPIFCDEGGNTVRLTVRLYRFS